MRFRVLFFGILGLLLDGNEAQKAPNSKLVSSIPSSGTQPSNISLKDILLDGKSTFTEKTLFSYLRGMDKLNRIQAELLERDDVMDDIPSFSNITVHINITTGPDQQPYLFEGDIILTEDQLQDIIRYNEFELYKKQVGCNLGLSSPEAFDDQSRKKRTLTSSTSLRWRNFPIPYMITSGVDRNAIAAGLKNWVDNTCITFQEVSRVSGNTLQFIYGDGCYSNIGMVGGVQQVSIGAGCNIPGIVSHEVGHALGYYHEHARFDRDNYVKIISQNIPSQYLSQFTKVNPASMTTFGVEYDLGSVMHYDPYSFTANGRATINTIDPNYQSTIGQRAGLSFNDIKKINFAYCNSTCSTRLNCQRSGYTDPKNCQRCRCPEGLSGTTCDQALSTGYNCGQINFHASNTLQSLSQSGYGICNYLISAPPGRRVLINVNGISFYRNTPCENTYLEVKFKKDLGNTGARFCDTIPNGSIFSEGEDVIVIYKGATNNHRFSITYRYDPATPDIGTTPPPTPQPITQQWWTTTQRWTQPPVQTTTQPSGGLSTWTSCSASCGGCGIQAQFRSGQVANVRYCNTAPCPGGWYQSNFCCSPFYYYAQNDSCYRYQDESAVTIPPSDWPFALSNRTASDPGAKLSDDPEASTPLSTTLGLTTTRPMLITKKLGKASWGHNKKPKKPVAAGEEIYRITSKPISVVEDLVAIDKEENVEGSGENL